MAQFLLSCESTVDVPYAYLRSRGIPVIFYSYIVDEQAYPDDMGRDPEALPRFYAFLDAGKLPSTSQINQFAYYDYFKGLLEQGSDVLYIAFGPFYSTDLRYFRRSGRVSGPAATVGAILGICPIMRLDDRGRIIAYDKVRGKNKKQETARDPITDRGGLLVCMQSRTAYFSRSCPE